MKQDEIKRRKEQNKKDSLVKGFKPMLYFKLIIEILVITLLSTSAYSLYQLHDIIIKG